jgi:hypothetical protein
MPLLVSIVPLEKTHQLARLTILKSFQSRTVLNMNWQRCQLSHIQAQRTIFQLSSEAEAYVVSIAV